MSQYNEAGWVGDLPELQEGRYHHGCSYFDNDDGTKVDWQLLILVSLGFICVPFQTLLVTGGNEAALLSSTEVLVGSASAWVFTGELPTARRGPRGANIDNKILMTGKIFL